MTDPAAPGADADRRGRLLATKLRAVVADRLGAIDPAEVVDVPPFPPGAALQVGDAAWLLLDDDPARRLGAALAWWRRRAAAHLHLVAERDAGTLARRAAHFDVPVTVWSLDGRALVWAEPAPHEPLREPPADHRRFVATIEAAGADVAFEGGAVVGEVAGLEVCRVVDDPHTGATRLEVGAGRHDREAFQLIHGDEPTAEVLAGVVAHVARHRQVGAPAHPFNRTAIERFLRWRIVREPALVGASRLVAVEPAVPRPGTGGSAAALGERPDGTPLLVVCSHGIDLELVPDAADARHRAALAAGAGIGVGEVETVLVVPARDRAAVTDELASLLRQSVSLVSID